MKTFKNIILGIVILIMTMGSFNLSFGQVEVLFSETYTYNEVVPLLDGDQTFSELINSDQTNPQGALLGICSASNTETIMDHLRSKLIRKSLPEDLQFAWDIDRNEGSKKLYALRQPNHSDSPGKQDIQMVIIKEGANKGSYDLLITFTPHGGKKWATMTRKNVDRDIAIVIDGKVVAAPKVTMIIKGGKCRISGDFNKEEASRIKAMLET